MAASYDAADPAPYDIDSADTLVLTLPISPVKVPAGWYSDPSWRDRLRYWDGQSWSELTSPLPTFGNARSLAYVGLQRVSCARAGRKSPLLAFVMVFMFGPLGMFYLSTLSGVFALLVGLALWQLLGWFAFLTYPLLWVGSLFYAPVSAVAANSRLISRTESTRL